MHEYTDTEQKDFQARAEAFSREYTEMYTILKEKHQCEFVYSVATVPSPQGVFGLGVQENIGDLLFKETGIPSPFVPEV